MPSSRSTPPDATLAYATLLERLARTLDASQSADLLTGDDVDAGDRADTGGRDAAGTPAAVLVPVVSRPEPTLLLTVRNANLRNHPGQIAFPGGRAEAGEDAVAAALREAREEVGLEPRHVRVLGAGDPYRTVTGFAVTPVLGVIPPDLPLVARTDEVADMFEVPLAFLTDPANHALIETEWRGRPRRYYEIAWGRRRVWGATAAIIVNLSRRLALAS